MSEREFINKYGFSLEDLYKACIYDIVKKTYWSYTISEVAFKVANTLYDQLNEDKTNCEGILYKLNTHRYNKTVVYDYDILIPYKDLVFEFTIGWVGNSISVKNWDLCKDKEFKEEEYNNLYELVDEEEELET